MYPETKQTSIDAAHKWLSTMFTSDRAKIAPSKPESWRYRGTVRTLKKPLFCVSDLHLGDGGPRDNFAYMADGERQREFEAFLDYVEDCGGELIILGDFFELWQGNMSEVIVRRVPLLDRLAKMKAFYVLGNHDADLLQFTYGQTCWLMHPFFERMRRFHLVSASGRSFYLLHGHEVDEFCDSAIPGLGRIAAIYAGLKEDRNGSPLHSKYPTVEARTLRRLEWPINFIRRLCGLPDWAQQMNRKLCELYEKISPDGMVSGHTHVAGKIAGWPIYNTGTWAEQTCSFVTIYPTGQIGVFDWIDGKPTPNNKKLFV